MKTGSKADGTEDRVNLDIPEFLILQLGTLHIFTFRVFFRSVDLDDGIDVLNDFTEGIVQGFLREMTVRLLVDLSHEYTESLERFDNLLR